MSNSIFSLEGKNALITGAGSGIGKKITEILYGAGANIALAARRIEKLEETKNDLEKGSQKVEIFSLDVTKEESIAECLKSIKKRMGDIDILVNNSGVTIVGAMDSHTTNEWDNVMDTNLRGPWILSKNWLHQRLEEKKKGGVIINVSSITGENPQKGNGIYAVSKSGLSHLTRQMALEWAKHGVRVNSIAPGYIRTDLNSDFIDSEMSDDMIRRIPMRRVGKINEIEGPILLLASEAGSYITGSTLVVDGGHLVSDL